MTRAEVSEARPILETLADMVYEAHVVEEAIVRDRDRAAAQKLDLDGPAGRAKGLISTDSAALGDGMETAQATAEGKPGAEELGEEAREIVRTVWSLFATGLFSLKNDNRNDLMELIGELLSRKGIARPSYGIVTRVLCYEDEFAERCGVPLHIIRAVRHLQAQRISGLNKAKRTEKEEDDGGE